MPCSPLEGGIDIYVWRYSVGWRRPEDLAGSDPVAGTDDAGPSVSDWAMQLAAARGPRVAALEGVAGLTHHATTSRIEAVKVIWCINIKINITTDDNIVNTTVKCYE